MGSDTKAKSTISFASGENTIAKGYASTTLGLYNDSLLLSDETSVSPASPLFIVGNGDAHASRSNAMVIQKNGNVGIGNSLPNANALLHVNTGANISKGLLVSGNYSPAAITPVLGGGSRMMFYPGKAAFRAGRVDGTEWDNDNVGPISTAFGYNAIASGYCSFALGFYTNARGTNSIANGYYSYAASPYSLASGFQLNAKGWASTVIGMNNDSLMNISELGPSSTTPLFVIGNGED